MKSLNIQADQYEGSWEATVTEADDYQTHYEADTLRGLLASIGRDHGEPKRYGLNDAALGDQLTH